MVQAPSVDILFCPTCGALLSYTVKFSIGPDLPAGCNCVWRHAPVAQLVAATDLRSAQVLGSNPAGGIKEKR